MFRLLLCAVLLIAVIVITESTNTRQDVGEKRGQQTLADVIKELNALKTKVLRMEMSRLRLMRGRDGRDGKDGTPGTPGRDGRDGKDGIEGPRGPRGLQGPSGQPGTRGSPGRNGGGVEYVRWGKTSCPAGANKVYQGYIGGAHYNGHGGGSNYVCLTKTPKYLNYKPGIQGASYIYGTEYQVQLFNPFTRGHLNNHDAPCVACHVQTRSSKLMIPGTYHCPSGWTREYYGYLMAERHNHRHSAHYVCVDRDAQVIPGTHANRDGALLQPVEGVCGSLPCQPYVNGRELTCVVCTK